MTAEVASRIDAGAGGQRRRRVGEAPRASQEAVPSREAGSQAALAARLGELPPRQGCWSDEGYRWLADHGKRRVEFTDGRIEELPNPTDAHQAILLLLHALFRAWVRSRCDVDAVPVARAFGK